jgi:acetylornithine deacetylase/succinyl-diaminopimelate desuccinylase-like protein
LRLGRLLLLGVAIIALFPACRRKAPSVLDADMTRTPEEWLRMEPVRLLHDYVRIESTDDRGEREGVDFLRHLLDCAGIDSEVVCPQPTRCNLLARVAGRRRSGALLLLNHVDVVGVYPPYWKEAAPFEGKIKLGFLYGRGAYDMKSLALSQLLALTSMKRRGVVPESDVLFLAEADEEGGQRWGSRWLLEHRPEWFEGVANVLNEGGTNEMILRTVRFWGIETLQAGHGLLELESADRAAVQGLVERWQHLPAETVEPHPHVVLGFDMLANHLGHPLTDPLRHLDRVRKDPRELAILPDRYGSFLEPRIKWVGPYEYPPGAKSTFRAYVVVSTPPGIDPGKFLAGIEADAASARITTVSRLNTGPTSASPYPTPFTEMIRTVIEAVHPGVPFGPVPTFGGSTTSIYFRNRGIAAYGFSPVPANITDTARVHGNDERIFLRDYLDGVNVFSEVLEEIAAGPAKTSPPPAAH